MERIPKLFLHDAEGKITPAINPDCQWVADGEGWPSRQMDGLSCKIVSNVRHKRWDLALGQGAPRNHVAATSNPDLAMKRDKARGWVPVGEWVRTGPEWPGADWWQWASLPEWPGTDWWQWASLVQLDTADETDAWFRDAIVWDGGRVARGEEKDGTYELCGPGVFGNPDNLNELTLLRHGSVRMGDVVVPRDFAGVREYLMSASGTKGLVWHHPDGRMAKVRRHDFY